MRRLAARPPARLAAAGVAAALAAGTLAACTPAPPDPEPAAAALADALEAGDLSSVPLAEGTDPAAATEGLQAAVAALGETQRTVELESVALDDRGDGPPTATARLRTVWDLDGSEAAPSPEAESATGGATGSAPASSSPTGTPTDSASTGTPSDGASTGSAPASASPAGTSSGSAPAPSPSDGDWTYTTSAVLEYVDEQWRVRYAPEVAVEGLGDGEVLRVRSTPAARGDILDGDGEALVTARPVKRFGIDKSRIEAGEAAASATELAELVDVDADAYTSRVEAAGAKAFVEAIVLRDDSSLDVTDADLQDIPGARALDDELPLAPTRTFARPLLGTVGEATAERVEASGGRLQPGDETGLSGLQAAYDERLAGTAGLQVLAAPGDGGTSGTSSSAGADDGGADDGGADDGGQPAAEPRLLFERPVGDGQAVRTTLDRRLQELAEGIVADAESPSAVVAVRPSDGHVLAAASGPEDNALNTAMLGQYAPGSTFKVVSALAMLRSGYTPDTEVQCPQTTVLDGREFKNFTGYPQDALGTITLAEAIAQSCNTVFIQAAARVDMPTLAEAAASLGLAAEPAVGAAAFLGAVPTDSTGTEHAANMIGQGVVQASVLGMATVAASVGHGGTVSPRLVQDPEPAAAPEPSPPLEAAEAEQLLEMMGGTVDHGTVTELQDVPGPAVAAKTGTAEYGDGTEDLRHTWVIAVHGDLAVAVFVETGFSGAETGGPLMKEFLTGAYPLVGGE